MFFLGPSGGGRLPKDHIFVLKILGPKFSGGKMSSWENSPSPLCCIHCIKGRNQQQQQQQQQLYHLGVALVIQWAAIRNSQKSRHPFASLIFTFSNQIKDFISTSTNLVKGREDDVCNGCSVVRHLWQKTRHHCLHLGKKFGIWLIF